MFLLIIELVVGFILIVIFVFKFISPIVDAVFFPYIKQVNDMKKMEKKLIKLYGENYRDIINKKGGL